MLDDGDVFGANYHTLLNWMVNNREKMEHGSELNTRALEGIC